MTQVINDSAAPDDSADVGRRLGLLADGADPAGARIDGINRDEVAGSVDRARGATEGRKFGPEFGRVDATRASIFGQLLSLKIGRYGLTV